MESLATRLSGLRKQHEANSKPFPLSHLLYLYEIGNPCDLYINNMEGFSLLVKWLSPIDAPLEQHGSQRIPRLSHSYELNRIAEILEIHPAKLYQIYQDNLKWILTSESNNSAIPVDSHSTRVQESTNSTNSNQDSMKMTPQVQVSHSLLDIL